ncbi:glycoside hydrolase family 2 protein [Vagococcus elongatus]|uniref:Glycoside hydrolase family 2 n=1 Tax=Vagococcus elongatus TaxID=180344 RepID=A0A430B110_9ENTE|nr:sugar-binding domain-containing protein [Vagococcus elongatus]RSU14004.1 glycoside hydrolase family 2 [Vagococcus elongatus]
MTELIDLYTPWGKKTKNEELPLNEYPRPQLVREHWQNLNGTWEYSLTQSEGQPDTFDGDILVPFSPESLLSGVQRSVTPEDILWYRRTFTVEKNSNEKVILHFGAVDQLCEVFVNHQLVGRHEGGYWPFSYDITEALEEENELLVKVVDLSDNPIYAFGKQKQEHGEIWYTPQSGIWQTVWLEVVPETYIKDLVLTPNFDGSQVGITINTSQPFQTGHLIIKSDSEIVYEGTISKEENWIYLPDFIPWTPDMPHLYELEITVDEDAVKSYFGMRKFSVGKNKKGQTVPMLNDEPIFFNGLLDQGYWSDGLYTPPSDEAMIWDIQKMKDLGFNMLRKHIKIEPLRWYYHCDKLGMLVWQDFVSGGGPEYSNFLVKYLPFVNIHVKDHHYQWFGRESETSRNQFEIEMTDTIDLLKNIVSLAAWVPFNEGWGQFDSTRIGDKVRELDKTRLVDYVSGYHDQGGGDFKSPHIYYKKYRLKADSRDRIQILSEFGGYSCPTEGHMGSERLFGYKMYETKEKLTTAYVKLFEEEIFPAISKGLAGTVYTQLSDVEEEINGLVTYDRHVVKVIEGTVRTLNQKIFDEFKRNSDG